VHIDRSEPSERTILVTAQQRSLTFLGAVVLAVIFLIIGVLYWTGHNPVQSGTHHKYAAVFFVLTVVALVVAYPNRPSVA
jgi:membrane protein YdbS with pleckstrin-like domain